MVGLSRTRRRGGRGTWSQVALHTVLTTFVALSLYPFFFMLITSVKDIDQFYHSYFQVTFPLHFGNYLEAWDAIHGYMLNSIVVTAASVSLILVLSTLSAYAFARFRFFGREVLFMAILVLMMLPDIITLVPTFVILRNVQLLDTLLALVAVYVSTGQIIAIFILRSFFSSIPAELVDAARIDGAGELQVLWNIFLPLSKAILFTVAIMTTLSIWNDYIWPLITISDAKLWTITVGLVTFQERYAGMAAWGPLFSGYVIASLPLIALFAVGMKHFIAGLTSGAVKA